MRASDEPRDVRAARRSLTLAMAAVLALLGGIAVLLLTRDDGGGRDQTVGAATIGPAPGTAIAGYLDQRRAALQAASGSTPRLAVVALTSYRRAADAGALLGGLVPQAWLVATPGATPVVVDGSLDDWAPGYRATLAEDRDGLASMLATVGDDAEYRAFYEREVARAEAALAAFDPGGAIVYGAVVRAAPGALRDLATKPEVRLVDVGPARDRRPGDAFLAPLPDEVDAVASPQLRPLPPG